MTQAPGKSHRKGITLFEVFERFRTDELAEAWFIEMRWPDGVTCPRCDSMNIQERKSRKPQPFASCVFVGEQAHQLDDGRVLPV